MEIVGCVEITPKSVMYRIRSPAADNSIVPCARAEVATPHGWCGACYAEDSTVLDRDVTDIPSGGVVVRFLRKTAADRYWP